MKTKRFICAVMCLVLIFGMMGTSVFAKSRKKNGIITDSKGYIYIYKNGKKQYGYVKYKGKTYYAHKTGSSKYPKGSVTTDEMRICGNKWYVFSWDGSRYDKDKYVRLGRFKRVLSIKIRKDHTVQYMYRNSAINHNRYSTKERRWQEQRDDGKWYSFGMQVIPEGWVDTQK